MSGGATGAGSACAPSRARSLALPASQPTASHRLPCRQHGLRGDGLARSTFVSRVDWAAMEPAGVQAALAAVVGELDAAGLPRHLAAQLWLASDSAVVRMWAQLACAGVPAGQLEQLATALQLPSTNAACFVSSMQLLHQLLGSWPAAAEAAAADTSLLELADSLLAEHERRPCDEAIAGFGSQLQAMATGREQLLRLAKCLLPRGGRRVSCWQAQGSLALLATLLGSQQAALEAAEGNRELLCLHPASRDMQTVFARLGPAGLSQEQLVQLAGICLRYSTQVDRLIWLADELYGGDWRAAALEFLRRWQVYVRCLCFLRPALDALRCTGLEAANEEGRRRVLQLVKVRPAPSVPLQCIGLRPV